MRKGGNEQDEQVLPGNPGTCVTAGAGTAKQISVVVVRGSDRPEDRLCAADVAGLGSPRRG